MAAAGQDGSIPDPNFLTTSLRECPEGMEEKKGFGSGGWCGEGRRRAWEAGGGVGLEGLGGVEAWKVCRAYDPLGGRLGLKLAQTRGQE